jgi:serine/threonine protein phosphatase PrpC
MKCPHCDQENRDIAQFCQLCGMPLRDSSPDPDAGGTADTVLDGEMLPEPETTEDCAVKQADVTPPTMPENQETGIGAEPVPEMAAPELDADLPASEMPCDSDEVTPTAPDTEETLVELRVEEPDVVVEEQEPTITPEPEATNQAPDLAVEEERVDNTPPAEDESADDAPLAEVEDQEALVSIEQEAPDDEDQDEMGNPSSAGLLPWRDEAASIDPVEEGTVLNGRYQVIHVLSDEPGENLYQVRDLQRCPQCGFAENSPDQAFCASCGAVMAQKPVFTLLERRIEHRDDPVEAEVQDQFADQDRAYWVCSETGRKAEPPSGAEGPMRMTVGQRSDTGRVRALDEDSLLALTMLCAHESIENTIALFVVADGMGGHEGGEIASKIAIQTLAHQMLQNIFLCDLDDADLDSKAISDWMKRAVETANDQVYLERQKRGNDMGTTVTAALLKDWTLYLAHVGDCRAYRWSEHGLEQLTTDHSVVASMVASGAAQPEEIYTHPQRSIIYRCVGDQPTVDVDALVLPINPGDRLIICCDGLWEMLHDEGIEDIMLREPDPQQACETMVEQANLAGGSDNISVIVVQV